MRIEFDPAKDEANRRRHGVSLMQAIDLDGESALTWVDERFDYGETRMVAFVESGRMLYIVVFVDRADARRIISVRRANRREVGTYVRKAKAEQDCHADPGRRQGDHGRGEG